jgi:hypothetical protein
VGWSGSLATLFYHVGSLSHLRIHALTLDSHRPSTLDPLRNRGCIVSRPDTRDHAPPGRARAWFRPPLSLIIHLSLLGLAPFGTVTEMPRRFVFWQTATVRGETAPLTGSTHTAPGAPSTPRPGRSDPPSGPFAFPRTGAGRSPSRSGTPTRRAEGFDLRQVARPSPRLRPVDRRSMFQRGSREGLGLTVTLLGDAWPSGRPEPRVDFEPPERLWVTAAPAVSGSTGC